MSAFWPDTTRLSFCADVYPWRVCGTYVVNYIKITFQHCQANVFIAILFNIALRSRSYIDFTKSSWNANESSYDTAFTSEAVGTGFLSDSEVAKDPRSRNTDPKGLPYLAHPTHFNISYPPQPPAKTLVLERASGDLLGTPLTSSGG
jgi:hypothetical protein